MNVQVRVWYVGGFGDVAAALKIADWLERQTKVGVRIVPANAGAAERLKMLEPEIEYSTEERLDGIHIDAIRWHDRDFDKHNIPHIFVEEMDMRAGPERSNAPHHFRPGMLAMSPDPTIYRPYREEELVKQDAKKAILDAAGEDAGLEKLLDKASHIAFTHLTPASSDADRFFKLSYVRAIEKAAANSESKYCLGLFMNCQNEEKISKEATERGYTVRSSTGNILEGEAGKPALLFLGAQTLPTTTKLFLSATMPNMVTGDQSLSDAIYALIAMEGKGFLKNHQSETGGIYL